MHLIKVLIRSVFISLLFLTPASGQTARIDSLETLLKTHTGTKAEKVDLLNDLAYELFNRDLPKAKLYVGESQRIISQIDYPKGKAANWWIIGLTCLQQDREKALGYFRKALTLAEAVDDKIGMCNYLTAIGNVTSALGDFETSIQARNQALQNAIELNDKRLILKCRINLAQTMQNTGNPVESARQLHEVIKLAKEMCDTLLLSKSYSNLSVIYNNQGDYPTTLKYLLPALRLYEAQNDSSSIVASQLNIANIYCRMKEFDKALETVQQARQLAKQINDSLQLSFSYTNTGNIYQSMGCSEVALSYFLKALHTSKNNAGQHISNLKNIALIQMSQNDFVQARRNLDEALVLAQVSAITNSIADVYTSIGLLNKAQKRYGQAVEYTLKALELAEKVRNIPLQGDCRKQLSLIYAASGDYKKAYSNSEQYKLLSDSILNEKNTRQVALLESAYQFDKEREVYELEKSKRKLQIENQRQIILLLVVISLLVFSLAVAVFWWSRLRKRMLRLKIENMNRELEANQKAMAVAKLKLIQNSEREAYHIQKLEDIRESRADAGDDSTLRQLISNYKLQANKSNWEEFEILFTKVNSSFFDKLGELCPTLTPNERKLCVFLKLNMSNKDIALITFQSDEALKKSRLRLRKKFNLDRSENLGTFIQNL